MSRNYQSGFGYGGNQRSFDSRTGTGSGYGGFGGGSGYSSTYDNSRYGTGTYSQSGYGNSSYGSVGYQNQGYGASSTGSYSSYGSLASSGLAGTSSGNYGGVGTSAALATSGSGLDSDYRTDSDYRSGSAAVATGTNSNVKHTTDTLTLSDFIDDKRGDKSWDPVKRKYRYESGEEEASKRQRHSMGSSEGRESDKREERKKDEKVLLYLGNMPSNVTKEKIETMFAYIPGIMSYSLQRHKYNMSNTCIFVEMTDREAGENLRKTFDWMEVNGRCIVCRFSQDGEEENFIPDPHIRSDNFEYKSGSASQNKSTDDSRSCVLVSNLPGDSTQDDLESFISDLSYSSVIFVKGDHLSGKPGHAYVYTNEGEKMVNELQGMYYLGSYIDAKVEEEKNRRKHKAPDFGELVDVPIDEALAENVTDLFRWGMEDELYYELIKDPETRRPANCEGLVTVETNQEIWELISHKTRTNDEKLQFIETTVVKAATLIAKVVNSLTSVEHESMMAGDVYSKSTTAAAENDSVKEKDAVGKYSTLDIDVSKIKAILEKCSTVETETVKAKDQMDKCTTVETASAKAGNVIDKSITVETDSTKVKDVIEKSTVVESDSGKGEDVMDKGITVESDSTKVKDVIKKSTVVESDSGKGEDVMDKGITVETDSAKVEDKNGNGSQVDTDSGKVEHVLGPWVPVETDTGPVIGPWVPVEPDPVHNEAVMGKHTMVGHKFGYHEDIMGKCMTALALLGHANRQICLTRKQFLKPELKTSYAKLCHHFIPYTGYLFGDDLNVRAKEEKEKYFQRWRGGKRDGRIASGGFSEVEGGVGIGGVSSKRGGRGAVRGLPSGRGGKGAVRGGPSDNGGRGGSRGQSSHRGRGRGFNPRGKSFFQS